MAAVSGVNIAMLPEEHAEVWEHLAKTGDIWACWLGHDPDDVQYEPAPPAEFLKRCGTQIQKYDSIDIYLGLKEAVLQPQTCTYMVTVGGTKVVQGEPGVYPEIYTIVGGTQVPQTRIDHAAAQLMRYHFGIINQENVMNRTTTSIHSSYLRGNQILRKPDDFLKWGKKVNAWLRKRIAGEVPVYRCNYSIPASALTIAAVKKGLKVI